MEKQYSRKNLWEAIKTVSNVKAETIEKLIKKKKKQIKK